MQQTCLAVDLSTADEVGCIQNKIYRSGPNTDSHRANWGRPQSRPKSFRVFRRLAVFMMHGVPAADKYVALGPLQYRAVNTK